MVDGNISMEEDTELRDLVVQTLENNGVLAKVRAELRASVFLALEEQESVVNPEPLLNKTVKQYLESSEGKLLFSLVREFLEYFGLDYTISVYDPETYFGKEYNYVGRNKLCEELGISTNEPLLGEILKSNINAAFITPQKNIVRHSRLDKTEETSTHLNNATFEINLPKVLQKNSAAWNYTDLSENAESYSEATSQIPFNVTITDNNKSEESLTTLENSPNSKSNVSIPESASKIKDLSTNDEANSEENCKLKHNLRSLKQNEKTGTPKGSVENNRKMLETINISNLTEPTHNVESAKVEQAIQTENTPKEESVVVENNVQNKNKIETGQPFETSVYFDEIIVDERAEKVGTLRNRGESLLGELPPLISRSNSIFSDLPPLNCKKTNINDLKELMQIAADGTDNYEEDFISSASGSANEQSPYKEESSSPSKPQVQRDETVYSEELIHSGERSEEIENRMSSKSFLEVVTDSGKNISKFTVGITADYVKEV